MYRAWGGGRGEQLYSYSQVGILATWPLPTGHGVSSLTLTHRVKVEARVSNYAPTQRSWSEQLGPNPGYGVLLWPLDSYPGWQLALTTRIGWGEGP